MDQERQEYIRNKVQDATAWSFEAFTFEEIIEDTGLSSQDVQWAKDNLEWKVVFIDESQRGNGAETRALEEYESALA